MSDLETQIENISYVLSELRDENNHKVITHCLQELQGVKKKVSQRELSITFEKQENQLLREYENKYLHAQKVIAELERELDDLKCQEHQAESPDDILMERTNFWKDKENFSHYTPEGKISSFKAMENFVADLEYKTLNKEKENEIDKTQIKQLEEQNAEYQQQVLYYSRELEELTKNVEEYQIRMSLAKDKSDTSNESSQRKAELDFLRGKVEDLEKEIQSKNSTISSLESKLKTTEDKTQVLATSLNEIMEENETLKTEKEEIKEAYKAAYDELKEKVIFKRDRSGERKCLVTYNNLPIKASVSDSREFSDSKSATHSEHHTPHDETLLRTKLEFPSNTKMSNFCPSSICNHEEKSLHEIEDEVVIHSSEEKPSQLHEEKTTAGAAKDSFSHYHDRQGFDNRSKAKSSQIEEDDSLDKLPPRKPYSLPKKKPQTFDEHLAGGHLGCCQTCNIF